MNDTVLTGIRLEVVLFDQFHPRIIGPPKDPTAMGEPQPPSGRIRVMDRIVREPETTRHPSVVGGQLDWLRYPLFLKSRGGTHR